MKKILINASNLHTGGGVQVATSFISELASFIKSWIYFDIHIYVSSVVDLNLEACLVDKSSFNNYRVIDVYGLQALKPNVTKIFEGFDAVFTIFGPLYLFRRIPNHIVGFAQLWILCPDNEVFRRNNFLIKIKLRLRFYIQWMFFLYSADRLIVELPHVKSKLINFRRYSSDKIDVVSNCVSSLYFDSSRWSELPFKLQDEGYIRIGYVSRSYPHKNLEILSFVAKELSNLNFSQFKFFVTLSDDEWNSFSQDFKSTIINVGPLNVTHCPKFYQSMDGVVFTSLLECFSATPIEAMIMRRPLFASNRHFVHDCCNEHAVYVDPLDPKDIASKIVSWFFKKSATEKSIHIENAFLHAKGLQTSQNRALSYMRIIENQLNINLVR